MAAAGTGTKSFILAFVIVLSLFTITTQDSTTYANCYSNCIAYGGTPIPCIRECKVECTPGDRSSYGYCYSNCISLGGSPTPCARECKKDCPPRGVE